MRKWFVTYTATVKEWVHIEAETAEEAVTLLKAGKLSGEPTPLRKPYGYAVVGLMDAGEVEPHDHE